MATYGKLAGRRLGHPSRRPLNKGFLTPVFGQGLSPIRLCPFFRARPHPNSKARGEFALRPLVVPRRVLPASHDREQPWTGTAVAPFSRSPWGALDKSRYLDYQRALRLPASGGDSLNCGVKLAFGRACHAGIRHRWQPAVKSAENLPVFDATNDRSRW